MKSAPVSGLSGEIERVYDLIFTHSTRRIEIRHNDRRYRFLACAVSASARSLWMVSTACSTDPAYLNR
jgi:hypothetical protein